MCLAFCAPFDASKRTTRRGKRVLGGRGGNDTMSQGNRRDCKSEREKRETTERLESLVFLAMTVASMARVRGY